MKRLRIVFALASGFLVSYCLMDTWKDSNIYHEVYDRLPLFGPSLVSAQAPGTSVVYQQILTSANTGPSANVRNIGQSMHSLTIQYLNAPSHTCSSPTLLLNFESSTDGSHYSVMGSPLIVLSGMATGSTVNHLIAYGAFPYVRINYASGDSTNCRINAFYSGTIYPVSVNAFNLNVNSNYLIQVNANNTVAALTPIGRLAGYKFFVYGMTLQSNGTGTVFTITEDNAATPGACNSPVTTYLKMTTVNNTPYIWQASSTPIIMASKANTDLCVAITVASGGDITNTSFTYRYE